MAAHKKKAQATKATLVFADESGFSLAPTRVRTWAPVGQTPVIVHRQAWGRLSAISAVTDRGKLLMMVRRGTIGTAQAVIFLRHLLRHLRGRIILVWDNLGAHHSKAVRSFVEQHRRRLSIEYLPAYSPELNPDEWVWRQLKQVELANLAPKNLDELRIELRRGVERIRKRPRLLRSFLEASSLSF
jgi:transposase